MLLHQMLPSGNGLPMLFSDTPYVDNHLITWSSLLVGGYCSHLPKGQVEFRNIMPENLFSGSGISCSVVLNLLVCSGSC